MALLDSRETHATRRHQPPPKLHVSQIACLASRIAMPKSPSARLSSVVSIERVFHPASGRNVAFYGIE